MSQCARVARWVPTSDPAEVGDGVITTAAPTAQKSLATKFALSGGASGGTVFANDADMVAGTETLKAVSPALLRTELEREFSIAAAIFANPIAASVGGSAGLLIKSDGTGRLDASFLPAVIDGGSY